MTYSLEVKRDGDMSDHSCNYKTRAGTTYNLEGGDVKLHLRLQNENRDDIPTSGGESGQCVRNSKFSYKFVVSNPSLY
jgi:hypothetical protein